MPFIGKQTTTGFGSVTKQDLTPDGSTTVFTLNRNVGSSNDVAVFVGNVRQEPTDAYSVSGTTLTMTAAPASGVNFYVLFIAGVHESASVPATDTVQRSALSFDVGAFKGDPNSTDGRGNIFRVHEKVLNTNVTIAGTENAVCAGPVEVATGITITVDTGGTLVVA